MRQLLHAKMAMFVLTFTLLCGCTSISAPIDKVPVRPTPVPPVFSDRQEPSRPDTPPPAADMRWTVRVITEEEICRLSDSDSELTPSICREILARLNAKSRYNIAEDVQAHIPMRVPVDFRSYRNWTPMPKSIAGIEDTPKLIIVDKSFPFLGWYEKGKLVGDTQACVGKEGEETREGRYTVLEKDADHRSKSYNNDLGVPAWMPWSLRLYDHVWIHAGDVSGPHCSHGCVTIPLLTAEQLYNWAEPGTPVLIVDDLHRLKGM